MNEASRAKYLSIALYVFGAIFVVGVYGMMMLMPASWTWEPRQPEYEQMIIGVYIVLGIFMIRAARNPSEHLSLIRFAIWSSLVHGLIMLVQALRDSTETPNLYGDIPALLLVAVVLWVLLPKKA